MSEQKLKNFLNSYRTSKIDKSDKPVFTHTGVSAYTGSYNIPPDKVEELYELIHNVVFGDKGVVSYITEKPPAIKPITVDCDLLYSNSYAERQHNVGHLKELSTLYCEVIRKYVNISEYEPIRVFAMERPTPYPAGGSIKDGIHLIIPIKCATSVQYLIYNEVIKNVMDRVFLNEAFGILPLKNDVNKIMDSHVIEKTNWTLYGCSKPGLARYGVTHIWDHTFSSTLGRFEMFEVPNIKEIYTNRQLISILSINRPDLETYKLREEFAAHNDTENGVNLLLNDPSLKITSIKSKVHGAASSKKSSSDGASRSLIDEAVLLTGILSAYRADEYKLWIAVGWCLYSISTSSKLFEAWDLFSKKSGKYKEHECETYWNTKFKQTNMGIGSLHMWALIDSPAEYAELRSTFIGSYITRSVSSTTQDIAAVIFQMYKHLFVCVTNASGKNANWYEFANHRWKISPGGNSLKEKIGQNVLNEYLQVITHYNTIAIEKSNAEKDAALDKSKVLMEITFKLRDITFKDKLMRECALMFGAGYENFENKINTNPNLICCENGVIDLSMLENIKTKEDLYSPAFSCFRDGRPEDMCMFSTDIDYPDREFSMEDPIIKDIMEFLSQIFPKEDVRDYVLKVIASILRGNNKHEKLYIFLGEGGNGKSKLLKLVELAVGQYFGKIPISFLTQKRAASNAASPEITRLKGRRFGISDEPSPGDAFNTGIVKQITGGDSVSARGLYQDAGEFNLQLTPIVLCNDPPKISSVDKAIKRRFILIKFPSLFVTNPNPDNPNEFKCDPSLNDKFEDWKETFLIVLIHYYKRYILEGLVPPPDVEESSAEYMDKSDIYGQFKTEMLKKAPGEFLRLDEAYSHFKIWFTNRGISGKVIQRIDFKTILTSTLGTVPATSGKTIGWGGWKLDAEAMLNRQDDINAADMLSAGTIDTHVTSGSIESRLRESSYGGYTPSSILDHDNSMMSTMSRATPLSHKIRIKPMTPQITDYDHSIASTISNATPISQKIRIKPMTPGSIAFATEASGFRPVQ